MIKRIIVCIFIVVLTTTLFACGEEKKTEDDTSSDLPEMTMAQENAYESAKSYIHDFGYSKHHLMDHLCGEYGDQYKKKDAEYAVKLLEERGEVDWNEEAVQAAKEYLENSSYSKDGLYSQLIDEHADGFTKKQARYAVDKVYK